MNHYRLFSDVTTVSRGNRIALKREGLLNANDTVISWSRLAPKVRDRKVTEVAAKCLVLIELDQPAPRAELVRRLVSYLSYSGKEKTMEQIEKLFKK
jgi:hypothetical protein